MKPGVNHAEALSSKSKTLASWPQVHTAGGDGWRATKGRIREVFQAPHQTLLQGVAFTIVQEGSPQIVIGDPAL